MARGQTLAAIADELGIEADEVLLELWDAGFEQFEDPNDLVPRRLLSQVHKVLGVVSHKERTLVGYWTARLGITRQELARRLADAGLVLTPGARRLPKGALKKLLRMYNEDPPAPRTVVADVQAPPPLKWDVVGTIRAPRLLTIEEIASIHEALEEDFALSDDPIVPPGVRDPNLLASAATRPETSYAEEMKYPTPEMATAALFHSLIHNHPFHNGNKRTALVSLLAQLDENGLALTATKEELFRFTLRTARHRLVVEVHQRPDREVLEIARWIRKNSRTVETGERLLRWGKLKQRLREFDCEFAPARSVGNRVNITRPVRRQRRFGMGARTETLFAQVACSGDGTDADRNTIHEIRKRLELDDANNVDSVTFYGGAKLDDFIIDYRRILQRLARL